MSVAYSESKLRTNPPSSFAVEDVAYGQETPKAKAKHSTKSPLSDLFDRTAGSRGRIYVMALA